MSRRDLYMGARRVMNPLSDRQVERLRDRLPTAEEVAAYALLFSLIWGGLVLLFVGCLP